ncbi:MAG: hypothetical protein IPK26_06565 [Planctomycetes bacterium]|nr:hypothetical protein [Planctomycetota bacterium]
MRVVAPAGSATAALAPASFLGDWRPLDGAGRLGLDLRVIAVSGAVAPIVPLVRLTGPGGTAVFEVPAAELPAGARTWKRFRAPIRAASWRLLNGSWSALLADVRECRILLDFAAGGATVTIDNVQRALDAARFPDDGRRTSADFGLTIAWQISEARLCTSLTVSGSHRVPSPTRNQPL